MANHRNPEEHPVGRASGKQNLAAPPHLTSTKNTSPYPTGVPEPSNLACPCHPTVSIGGQKWLTRSRSRLSRNGLVRQALAPAASAISSSAGQAPAEVIGAPEIFRRRAGTQCPPGPCVSDQWGRGRARNKLPPQVRLLPSTARGRESQHDRKTSRAGPNVRITLDDEPDTDRQIPLAPGQECPSLYGLITRHRRTPVTGMTTHTSRWRP